MLVLLPIRLERISNKPRVKVFTFVSSHAKTFSYGYPLEQHNARLVWLARLGVNVRTAMKNYFLNSEQLKSFKRLLEML